MVAAAAEAAVVEVVRGRASRCTRRRGVSPRPVAHRRLRRRRSVSGSGSRAAAPRACGRHASSLPTATGRRRTATRRTRSRTSRRGTTGPHWQASAPTAPPWLSTSAARRNSWISRTPSTSPRSNCLWSLARAPPLGGPILGRLRSLRCVARSCCRARSSSSRAWSPGGRCSSSARAASTGAVPPLSCTSC